MCDSHDVSVSDQLVTKATQKQLAFFKFPSVIRLPSLFSNSQGVTDHRELSVDCFFERSLNGNEPKNKSFSRFSMNGSNSFNAFLYWRFAVRALP